jgi:hypothetical protein
MVASLTTQEETPCLNKLIKCKTRTCELMAVITLPTSRSPLIYCSLYIHLLVVQAGNIDRQVIALFGSGLCIAWDSRKLWET